MDKALTMANLTVTAKVYEAICRQRNVCRLFVGRTILCDAMVQYLPASVNAIALHNF
jgi:hypothetical protein